MNKDDVAGLVEKLTPALKLLEELEVGQDCAEYAYAKGKGFQAMTYTPEAFEALRDLPATLDALTTLSAENEKLRAALAVLTPSQRLLADKGMPVVGMDHVKYAIPWYIFDHLQAQRNHGGQTLLRLAERGGLDWTEAAAIVQKRDWFAMEMDEAEKIVRQALAGE